MVGGNGRYGFLGFAIGLVVAVVICGCAWWVGVKVMLWRVGSRSCMEGREGGESG